MCEYIYFIVMSSIERHPEFDPAVKLEGVMDVDSDKKQPQNKIREKVAEIEIKAQEASKHDEDLGFDLFTTPIGELKEDEAELKSE